MRYIESSEQKVFVQWFKIQYPHFAKQIMAIPNGQNVGPIVGRRLKDMGLLPGAPDIFIAVPTAIHNGLFIEMKTKGGRVSKEQAEVHDILRRNCYRVSICWSADEAMLATKEYFCDNKP